MPVNQTNPVGMLVLGYWYNNSENLMLGKRPTRSGCGGPSSYVHVAPAALHVLGHLSYHWHTLTIYQDTPLATNLNYSVGQAQITVPDVPTGSDYIVVCKWLPRCCILCHAQRSLQCSAILGTQVPNSRLLTAHLHRHPLSRPVPQVRPRLSYQHLRPRLQQIQILLATLGALPRHS